MKKNKTNIPKRPISILVWGDSPATSTGFATVTRNVFTRLAYTGKYAIDIIGINDRGGYKDPMKYPFKIYPAKIGIQSDGDYHGRDRLIASLLKKDPDIMPPWDIVFTLNDPFILDQSLPVFNKGTMEVIKEIQSTTVGKLPPEWYFKTVSYWPIDSPLRGNWINNVISLSDYSVAYTKYGLRMIREADEELNEMTNVADRTDVIYHGINTKEFYPLEEDRIKKFREKYFEGKVRSDTFLISAIARNQLRKDLPRTMSIFKKFQDRRPNSFLYFHCQESDAWGSLREYARNWNLKLGQDWGVPANFSANTGYPIEFMNLMYNASDAILSTSLGEGFGFYNLEGFATKKVVIAPNNSTHPELFNYDKDEDISDMESIHERLRGVPIKCGSTSSEWATYGAQDFERIRPLTNVDDAVKKLIWIYDNPEKAKKIGERAYEWVQQYDWDIIAKKWDEYFQGVYNELEKERSKIVFKPTTREEMLNGRKDTTTDNET